MTSVTLLDYGVGNLKSVARALEESGANLTRATTAAEVAQADRLVLPGVGAFSACTKALNEAGLWDAVAEHGMSQKPFLGICVGMQMMFDTSEEFGQHSGFGFIPGKVTNLPAEQGQKVPFVGWKPLDVRQQNAVFAPDEAAHFYLVHSFAGTCDSDNDCLATYRYGTSDVTAVVGRDAMLGTQFHPEKSGQSGLALLQKFAGL